MRKQPHTSFAAPCSFRVYVLAFLWTSCYLLGIYISTIDPSSVTLMRLVPMCQVSIVGLSIVLVLPLFVLLLGLYFEKSSIVFSYCAYKAFCAGYLLFAIYAAYRSAGWLVCCLLCFSDFCITMITLFLSVRHIGYSRPTFLLDASFSVVAVAGVGVVDYLLVAPYLQQLFS